MNAETLLPGSWDEAVELVETIRAEIMDAKTLDGLNVLRAEICELKAENLDRLGHIKAQLETFDRSEDWRASAERARRGVSTFDHRLNSLLTEIKAQREPVHKLEIAAASKSKASRMRVLVLDQWTVPTGEAPVVSLAKWVSVRNRTVGDVPAAIMEVADAVFSGLRGES